MITQSRLYCPVCSLVMSMLFTFRCWVLLDHEYNIFLMKEGVLRTSSEPYDADDLTNTTSHLTNHCIQVKEKPHLNQATAATAIIE